jgi:hypothetical protein
MKIIHIIILNILLLSSVHATLDGEVYVVSSGEQFDGDISGFFSIGNFYTSALSGATDCTENWSCTAWTDCVGGSQTRTCTDSNSCGTVVSKPSESQSCTVPSGGGGGSSTSTCQEGQITTLCTCGGQNYNSGFCIDNVWYLNNLDFETPTTNESIIVSNKTKNMYFTILSEKYAYAEEEDIEIFIDVFEGQELIDVDKVYFEVYLKNISYGDYQLTKYNQGKYKIFFDNNLDVGDYVLKFYVKENNDILIQDKNLIIHLNPDLINTFYSSTGKFRQQITFWITCSITLLIILCVLYMNRRKLKNQLQGLKRKWKKNSS